MKTYYGNYLGMVVTGGEKDPEGRGRCQVFIPHIMPALYEGWNKEGEDISFDIVGDGLPTNLKPEIVETLKKILPWAECAAPIVGSSPSAKDGDEIKRNVNRALGTVAGLGPVENLNFSNREGTGGAITQNHAGKIRSQDLSSELQQVISNGLAGTGLNWNSTSGGQPTAGNGPRTGSTRHDLGNATDGQFVDAETGRVLNADNLNDRQIISAALTNLYAAGITSVGWDSSSTGGGHYMGSTTFHLDIDPRGGVWGHTMTSSSAASWILAARNAASSNKQAPLVNHSAINPDVGVNMRPDGKSGGFDYEVADLNLTDDHKQSLSSFLQNYQKNKGQYEAVSSGLKQAGISMNPSQVAAIHWREASGSFNKSIANGENLGGYIRKDGRLGQGNPSNSFTPTNNWVTNSVEVLSYKVTEKYGGPKNLNDPASFNDFAERFNGLGYKQRGLVSPYVYAGTDLYTGGKFTSDGKFDSGVFDKQVGTAVLAAAAEGTLETGGLITSSTLPGGGNVVKNPTDTAGSYGPNTNFQALGMFGYASEGTPVWVFFREGNPLFPVYFAASYGQKEWQNMYQHSSQGIGCGDGGAIAGTEKMRFNSYGGGFDSTQVMENPELGLEGGCAFQVFGKNGSNLLFAMDHTEFNSVYNHNQRVSGDFHEITEANKETRVRGDKNTYVEQDVYITVGNWSDEAIAASDEIQEYINEAMRIKSGKGSSQQQTAYNPTQSLAEKQQTISNTANKVIDTVQRFTSKRT
jgi:lysozyme family protein